VSKIKLSKEFIKSTVKLALNEDLYPSGDITSSLINKDNEFEFIEEDSSDLTSSYAEKDTLNLSRVIEKNRKIIKRYQTIVRTAVTLDALMDSENEENYKIK